VNGYLEATGDYGGAHLLPMFQVYRAMVRAKVSALRAAQLATGRDRRRERLHDLACIRLADRFTRARTPSLVVTHGVSGCGKTTTTEALVERIGALRVRTDVERKRLAAAPAEHGRADMHDGLYSESFTRRVYARVLDIATDLIDGDATVIVDGAFLLRWQRDLFRDRARDRRVPFVVLDFTADEATLRDRIRGRARGARDASDADERVLEHQLRTREALNRDELDAAVTIDGRLPPSEQLATTTMVSALGRIGVDSRRCRPADATAPRAPTATRPCEGGGWPRRKGEPR
jgi:predicted kinase